MPRPSLKQERRAEILDAYGRCVARYGVEGATLERTADEAGLARALIRHHVGNKDQLLEAFVDQFLDEATATSRAFFDSLAKEDRLSSLLYGLFDPSYSNPHQVRVTSALLMAATEYPALAKRLRCWIVDFVSGIQRELHTAFPQAEDDRVEAVANGMVALYFNLDTLTTLGGMKRLRSCSEEAARLLISTLSD